MKWVSLGIAVAIAILGLWILGLAFVENQDRVPPEDTPVPAQPNQSLAATGDTPGAQLAVGFALLAGGVFAVYLVARKG